MIAFHCPVCTLELKAKDFTTPAPCKDCNVIWRVFFEVNSEDKIVLLLTREVPYDS